MKSANNNHYPSRTFWAVSTSELRSLRQNDRHSNALGLRSVRRASHFALRATRDKSTPHGRQVFEDFLNTSHKPMGRDLSRFFYGVPIVFTSSHSLDRSSLSGSSTVSGGSLRSALNHPRLQDEGFYNRLTEVNWGSDSFYYNRHAGLDPASRCS